MRTLVIEDDGATRAVLVSTLRARRHEIVACEDAEAAWAALATQGAPPFDLALVDVGLPGQDGIAFCRQFRRQPVGRHAVLVLVTADERPGTLEAGLEAGVHDYVLKPIDRRTFAIRLAIAEQRSLANATSRHSREALRESESRFEAFMSNSPAAAFIKDGEGRFLYVNRGYLDAFRVTEGDRLGRTHWEVYPPEVAAAQQRSSDAVLRTGQPQESLETVILPDGPHEWLTYKFPLEDTQGHPSLVAALAIDVTARLNAERALQAQAAQLRNEQARAETVLRVAARLNALGDLQAVLDAVCEEVRAALGEVAATLSLVDRESGDLRRSASAGMAEKYVAFGETMPREIWERIVPRFTPLLHLSDLAEIAAPHDPDLAESLARRHGLIALVLRESRIVGTLAIWSSKRRAFTADEHALLQGVADQAGLAITNIRLLDDVRQGETRVRRERDRAEALLRISRTVSESSDLRDTLDAVCTQTRLALGTSRASVLLYYPLEKALRAVATSGAAPGLLPPSAFAPSPLWVHERMAPLHVPVVAMPDIRAMDYSPNFQRLWDAGLRSIVFVRMVRDGELVGLVTAGEIGRTRAFTDEEMALLRGISEIGALAIGNARLIEERRRTEEQMRNAQKLESLGVLAGGIAHDFNNLLVGVLGNAGLALMELPEDSPARQAVKDIETSAQRAADLTRQMLAYSGRGKFLVEPVNLSRIVEEMTQLLGRVISKQAHLELHLAPNLPAIVADATQLRQVVMNLITNASDALDGNPGLITLTTSVVDASPGFLASTYLNEELLAGSYVCLEVHDRGAGMDETTRARIFEPFFTTKFTGRGLGLAAVLGIVRGHHGAIDVQSAPGSGTSFRVLFPAAPAEEAADAAAGAPASQWRGSGEILLVDDDETVRAVAARVLERTGFEVVQAESGEQALVECERLGHRLRGVVLDLTMPGQGGEATFRQISERWPALPVIVSSGYMPQEGELGGIPFLAKPYRPSELLDLLRGVLERAAAPKSIA